MLAMSFWQFRTNKEKTVMKKAVLVLGMLVLLLTACAPNVAPEPMLDKPVEVMTDEPIKAMAEESMAEEPTEAMADEAMAEEPMADKTMADEATSIHTAMADAPAWFGATLTNVRTDEDFTINDFKGKVVLVETLAMWCPNCKRQQQEVQALHAALGEMGGDLVSIGLAIDPNEQASDLKAYTDANGFDWLYAVASPEVSRTISGLYGDQFLNPPSTPMLVIDRQGEVHLLPFGIKSADDLKRAVEPFLNEDM
jgi:thiol-disulfide isomerase/thioredoxin